MKGVEKRIGVVRNMFGVSHQAIMKRSTLDIFIEENSPKKI